ncbi:hypothetical protein ACFXPA_29250 [Amycolatopsis sp. NPDC059090]|uniref:hypothetical protein n=1 Tax=unclassified Amycolatopsis TaxID=2618356 RepID=UPI00366C115A
MNDPMTVEMQGEAFTYPAVIEEDADGRDLAKATKVLQSLSKSQIKTLMGEVGDWPAPPAHINKDHTSGA